MAKPYFESDHFIGGGPLIVRGWVVPKTDYHSYSLKMEFRWPSDSGNPGIVRSRQTVESARSVIAWVIGKLTFEVGHSVQAARTRIAEW